MRSKSILLSLIFQWCTAVISRTAFPAESEQTLEPRDSLVSSVLSRRILLWSSCSHSDTTSHKHVGCCLSFVSLVNKTLKPSKNMLKKWLQFWTIIFNSGKCCWWISPQGCILFISCNQAVPLQSNVLDRALDWIFSHLDDLDSMDVSEGGRSAAESEGGRDPPPGPRVKDGPGSEFWARRFNKCCFMTTWHPVKRKRLKCQKRCKHQKHQTLMLFSVSNPTFFPLLSEYELFAFISHMGTSTMCGHYVCHIKKGQQ